MLVSTDFRNVERLADVHLGLSGDHQESNASLAVALASTWLQRHAAESLGLFNKPTSLLDIFSISSAPPYSISETLVGNIRAGLEATKWPGRAQIIQDREHPNIFYYLDGAHTVESMLACCTWFDSESHVDANVRRSLLFSCTGKRQPGVLLEPVAALSCRGTPFDSAVFVPCLSLNHQSPDHVNRNSDIESEAGKFLTELKTAWGATNGSGTAYIANSIEEGISILRGCHSSLREHHILVTGSLHLVGGAMRALGEPVQ